MLNSFHGAEAVRCTVHLLVISVRLQVVPELMSVWFPPVTTSVILNVFRSHTRPSPHPRLCRSLGREKKFSHCVSSGLQACWILTRGYDQLSHSAGDFLHGDAQRNSTRNLGPQTGNSIASCTCEIGTSLQYWPVYRVSDTK